MTDYQPTVPRPPIIKGEPPVNDPNLRMQWWEAEQRDDWAELSRLQTAEDEPSPLPDGFSLVLRPDFIDRR